MDKKGGGRRASNHENRQRLAYVRCDSFFDDRENWELFRSVVGSLNGAPSLRLIEFACVRWIAMNEHPITYRWRDTDVDLGVAYSLAMREFRKEHFDCFLRGSNYIVIAKHGEEIMTSVAQANFFRWAIENGVLQYITLMKPELAAAMKLAKTTPQPHGEQQQQQPHKKRRKNGKTTASEPSNLGFVVTGATI
jgi:hypothetical protein